MTTRYLSKKNIVQMHYELIERFGGIHGIRDESLLESAVGRYQSGYYDDCIAEAAALMESLGGNHPFLDGNKRIATTAPFIFLNMNGYEALIDEEEAFAFITTLFESHEFSLSRLEPWIRSNTKLLNSGTPADEAIEDEEPPQSEALMSALARLFGVIQEANFLLEQRANEVGLVEAAKRTGNPILLIESAMKWMKTAAADFNLYSDRIEQHGDNFLRLWTTTAQWTEDQIPRMRNVDRLRQLSDSFQEMKTVLGNIKISISEGTKKIASTTDGFGDLRQSVNAIHDAYKAIGDQILAVLEGYEDSIARYTKAQQYFDEQLAITIDSCNRLTMLITRRIADQQ
ncbi:MAG: type II toxin-antitoxin system death-on-curing family toxin [Blastocatellia bacterium]